MKNTLTYFLCFSLVFLPGCQALGMTPEQIQNAKESLAQQRQMGNITEAQYESAIEALDAPASIDWSSIIMTGGSILGTILLGIPISVGVVNRKRGPVATPDERAARSAVWASKKNK